ncbi:hypothetical protein EK599_19955 [Vibrio sp. T187]|uniref:ParB N-terminal domain-containing protein n=1 Tax=Vibrio TaxID=662 RepID=UPI0010C9CB6F|nr:MULTISPECIES: ParB N-terminal domain-containing protein [Vibrio]MBW3697961.1 hypothetical protein [Vibrio sp. T187]
MDIKITEIHVGKRLRPVNPDTVSILVSSIKDNGLLEAIKVRSTDNGYMLVDGNHRLQAHQALEHEYIKVQIIDFQGTPEEVEQNSRLAELDTNLATETLSEPQRHAHIYERLNLMVARKLAKLSALDDNFEKERKSHMNEAKALLVSCKWAKDTTYINSAVSACKALSEYNLNTAAQGLDSRVYRRVVSAAKKATRLAKNKQRNSEEDVELTRLKSDLAKHNKLAEVFNIKPVSVVKPTKSKFESILTSIANLTEEEKKQLFEQLERSLNTSSSVTRR